MSIGHQSSFNSGELSSKMNGRSDLEVYRNGCSFLENFFVLPQGGVERRAGTEFINNTGETDPTAGTAAVRMIPFIFSADEAYACEFGAGYIRVWSSDGTSVLATETTAVPYAEADLSELVFDQRFDVMFIAHPDHPVHTLSRTTTTPTFEFDILAFEYPPFLDENSDTAVTVKARHLDWSAGTYYQDDPAFYLGAHYKVNVASTTNSPPHADWTLVPEDEVVFNEGDSVTITSVGDVFTDTMDDAYFRIRHPLSEAKRLTQGKLSSSGATSDVVYVGTGSAFDYKIKNGGGYRTPSSTCVIESNSQADFLGTNNIEATLSTFDVFKGSITPAQAYVRVRKTNASSYSTFEIERQTNRSVDDTIVVATTDRSDVLDVSFSNWTAKVVNQPTNTVTEIERSTDDQETWETFVILGDTRGGVSAASFSYSSPSKEGATTFVRIKTDASVNINVTIVNTSLYTEGVFQLDTYVSATEYTATVKNRASSAGSTSLWSEGAFSGRRGYARATRFHQDRFWLAGSNYDTATVYGSISGDYYNFLQGEESDLSIKRIIDTSESIKWLIGKKHLFSGTTGGIIQITSADQKENLTANNIQTNPQSVFGASSIQGVLANDVVVYPQRNNLKLREMIYNWEEENFRSNDLTILNDEILSGVVKEVFLQKQPDQIVWCIMDDGNAAILTYERQQEVVGWARVVTDGDIISGCSIPTATGEDEVWLCVKRLGAYMIEKFKPRADLDWYVDSAVEYDGGACVSADSITIGASPDFKITVNDADNSVSDGDKVRLENVVGLDWLEGKTFTVADRTASLFVLKDAAGSSYINASDLLPSTVTVVGAGTSQVNQTDYDRDLDTLYGGKYGYVSSASNPAPIIGWEPPSLRWRIYINPDEFYINTDNNPWPPKTGWTVLDGAAPAPTLSYTGGWETSITGDYCVVQNTLSGLDHLDDATVQVVADGIYVQDAVVSSGSITLDDYANTIIAGLEYDSTLRTMPIEPVLANRLPMSRVKGVAKATAKFQNTIGGKINEKDKPPNTYPALKVDDTSGEPIQLKTGETKFNISSDWEREKIIEIKQDLPYPMTVLSLTVWAEVKGG